MEQDLKDVADRAKHGAQALPRTAATLLSRVLRPSSGSRSANGRHSPPASASVESLLRDAEVASRRAEQARREAAALEEEACDRARVAEAAAKEAEEIAHRAQEAAAQMAADAAASADRLGQTASNGKSSSGDLEERTKAELLDLAAEADIEGRSSMTKPELIRALSNEEGRNR